MATSPVRRAIGLPAVYRQRGSGVSRRSVLTTFCEMAAVAKTFASKQFLHNIADTLAWSRSNDTRFPALNMVAVTYIGTSAPSERVFSLAGNICSRQHTYKLVSLYLDTLVLDADKDILD